MNLKNSAGQKPASSFLQAASGTKNWHAVYTRSRAEKAVLRELEFQDIEAYLPLEKKLRKWSDRKKWVETPLISGYLFVHISRKEYDRVLQTQGVVTYVRFEGKAAIIPEEQIETIKRLLRQNEVKIEVSTRSFEKGDSIEVIGGPLMGTKGKLIKIKGRNKVSIELEQLNVSLIIELPVNEIKKV